VISMPRRRMQGSTIRGRACQRVLVGSTRECSGERTAGVVARVAMGAELSHHVLPTSHLRDYTAAGTRAAVLRISCRSEVNSEIVLVATVATGRALRPVGSVFDTITTLSM
jgi:hypothetical protein